MFDQHRTYIETLVNLLLEGQHNILLLCGAWRDIRDKWLHCRKTSSSPFHLTLSPYQLTPSSPSPLTPLLPYLSLSPHPHPSPSPLTSLPHSHPPLLTLSPYSLTSPLLSYLTISLYSLTSPSLLTPLPHPHPLSSPSPSIPLPNPHPLPYSLTSPSPPLLTLSPYSLTSPLTIASPVFGVSLISSIPPFLYSKTKQSSTENLKFTLLINYHLS